MNNEEALRRIVDRHIDMMTEIAEAFEKQGNTAIAKAFKGLVESTLLELSMLDAIKKREKQDDTD